ERRRRCIEDLTKKATKGAERHTAQAPRTSSAPPWAKEVTVDKWAPGRWVPLGAGRKHPQGAAWRRPVPRLMEALPRSKWCRSLAARGRTLTWIRVGCCLVWSGALAMANRSPARRAG